MPVFDKKYIKAKVREFNSVINSNFQGDQVPKQGVHLIYIDYIIIDSVMRMGKLFRKMQIRNKENKGA